MWNYDSRESAAAAYGGLKKGLQPQQHTRNSCFVVNGNKQDSVDYSFINKLII